MGSIMAKLVIISTTQPPVHLKAFNCYISKLCALIIKPKAPDTLYHNGSGAFPVDGDTIYKMNPQSMQYELFKNNSAALMTMVATEEGDPYILTNNNGICKIKHCKAKWQHSL